MDMFRKEAEYLAELPELERKAALADLWRAAADTTLGESSRYYGTYVVETLEMLVESILESGSP